MSKSQKASPRKSLPKPTNPNRLLLDMFFKDATPSDIRKMAFALELGPKFEKILINIYDHKKNKILIDELGMEDSVFYDAQNKAIEIGARRLFALLSALLRSYTNTI